MTVCKPPTRHPRGWNVFDHHCRGSRNEGETTAGSSSEQKAVGASAHAQAYVERWVSDAEHFTPDEHIARTSEKRRDDDAVSGELPLEILLPDHPGWRLGLEGRHRSSLHNVCTRVTPHRNEALKTIGPRLLVVVEEHHCVDRSGLRNSAVAGKWDPSFRFDHTKNLVCTDRGGNVDAAVLIVHDDEADIDIWWNRHLTECSCQFGQALRALKRRHAHGNSRVQHDLRSARIDMTSHHRFPSPILKQNRNTDGDGITVTIGAQPVSAPLVTIGIPVYNGSNYLKAALSSILEQDHEHLEILIADNASTDDSLAIVSAVADGDPRVRILGSDTNRGAAWNYNRLVDEATGEYFKWAAHDDVCLPNYVSSCVGVLQTRPEVVLTYPQTSIIDSEGLVVKDYDENLRLDIQGDIKRGASMLWNIGLCNAVFGVVRTASLRDTKMIQPFDSSDVALLAEIAIRGRVVQVDGRSFLRRRHKADSRAANQTTAEVSEWFSPHAARGRTGPLLTAYMKIPRSWSANLWSRATAMAMFATVGTVTELRWHRRRRRRIKKQGNLR